jgi:hypothetical protein
MEYLIYFLAVSGLIIWVGLIVVVGLILYYERGKHGK